MYLSLGSDGSFPIAWHGLGLSRVLKCGMRGAGDELQLEELTKANLQQYLRSTAGALRHMAHTLSMRGLEVLFPCNFGLEGYF